MGGGAPPCGPPQGPNCAHPECARLSWPRGSVPNESAVIVALCGRSGWRRLRFPAGAPSGPCTAEAGEGCASALLFQHLVCWSRGWDALLRGPLAKSLLPLHRSSSFRCRAMAHGPGPSSLNFPQDFWGVLGIAHLPASSLLLSGPGLVQGCFLSA